MEVPTKDEVREKLISLIEGTGSREEIENWASNILVTIFENEKYTPVSNWQEVPDEIFRAVDSLSGCAERDGGPSMPYVYDRQDFKNWLAELEAGD